MELFSVGIIAAVVVSAFCEVDSMVVTLDDEESFVVIGFDDDEPPGSVPITVVVEVVDSYPHGSVTVVVVVCFVDDGPHGSGSAVVVYVFSIIPIQTGVRPINVTPTIVTEKLGT